MTQLAQAERILLPDTIWQEIIAHCKRKIAGEFLPGETEVNRAYGMLTGSVSDTTVSIERVLTLKKNARNVEPLKTYMDSVMIQHAKPSTTPLGKRGWITDPEELKACYDECERDNLQIFGTYHIHIVPWKGDPLRDTPTYLDTILAKNSNLFTFIVAMVDISRPSIRAFYEGDINKEIPLVFESEQIGSWNVSKFNQLKDQRV